MAYLNKKTKTIKINTSKIKKVFVKFVKIV